MFSSLFSAHSLPYIQIPRRANGANVIYIYNPSVTVLHLCILYDVYLCLLRSAVVYNNLYFIRYFVLVISGSSWQAILTRELPCFVHSRLVHLSLAHQSTNRTIHIAFRNRFLIQLPMCSIIVFLWCLLPALALLCSGNCGCVG